MEKLKIKVINKSNFELPTYETPQSAGADLRANIDEPYLLLPGFRVLIKTGIFMALPVGYEAQIRSRSGLALKYGVVVLNAPGTIDADYRGEIGVLLYNVGQGAYQIKPGERIAQMVIAKHDQGEFIPVETLDDTERGEGGFGHTGQN